MGIILDTIVRFVCVSGFIFGTWLLFSPIFIPAMKNAIYISRFRRDISKNESDKKNNKLIEHITILIHIVFNRHYKNGAYTFFALSIALFVTSLLLIGGSSPSNILVFILSLMFGFSPYLLLQVLLRYKRVKGSYEAEELVTEFINQYKINNLNAIDAIDRTLIKIDSLPYSQSALFRLSLSIKEYRNESELDFSIREFMYSFDTEWASLLGMNIKIAISDGTDVRASLDDILKELENVRKVIEKGKRYNHESFSMIKYVIPGAYLFTIYFAIKVFGFTLKKFFTYQLYTDLGLKFAIVTYASFILNFIVLYLNSKPKYDI